ncbi:MAG: hypothetical protein COA57_05910 [Flavobacteriales bacterium]|nr:MAG: hypothetical protein COA57_05910 [Flavobacteriales bacterium]
MTAEELRDFISSNILTFDNLKIIENGVAYHYTTHFDKIEKTGKFLGAPIDKNLDQTQVTLPSKPATNDLGVVFAYLDEEETRDEGCDCDIVEIEFTKALKATHVQEATLGAPDTILILNTDIKNYKNITGANNT